MPETYDAVIVGAGILGLAHAYQFAKSGRRTLVIERGHRALGASVRNFGMIWPVGQPPGEMREIALRSREIWLEMLAASGIWHRRSGSLHLAYHEDELEVLREFVAAAPDYGAQIIGAPEAVERSPVIRADGLLGAMWSATEVCVNPRVVIEKLPGGLRSRGVDFRFGTAVSEVSSGKVLAGGHEVRCSEVVICNGDDFETLFPERFAAMGMTRCKLQMMKARPKRPDFQIGTHLCAGLTLGHYGNFRICPGLPSLRARFAQDYPEHVHWGVHLLVSQHESGELTIGDSHEYGMSPDPFLREELDRLILSYLDTFLPTHEIEITERWHGVYAKHPERSYIVEELAPHVTAVTGVGGAGMTLSFGLAESVVSRFD